MASLVVAVVLAVACVPVGFAFVAIGHPGAVQYAAVFALLMLLSAGYAYVTRVRPRHRQADVSLGDYDGVSATELRHSGVAFGVLVGVMACLTTLAVFASLDFFLAGTEVTAPRLAGTLAAVAAVFIASSLVSVITGRLRRGRVVLTPHGVYQRGRAFSSYLPWDAVAGAKASYDGLTPYVLVIAYANAQWDRRQHARMWKLDKLPPVPMIAIDCTIFTLDHNLIYHLVKFYVDNPQTRTELGTQDSIQRAHTRAFA